MVKKLWRYVKPFLSNTGTLRMDGQTDRRTDRIAISISRVSVSTRDKKLRKVVYRSKPSTIIVILIKSTHMLTFSFMILWTLKVNRCYVYVRFSLFLYFCFSEGSIATRLRCDVKITRSCCRFIAESNSKIISKSDQYLLKLCLRLDWNVFIWFNVALGQKHIVSIPCKCRYLPATGVWIKCCFNFTQVNPICSLICYPELPKNLCKIEQSSYSTGRIFRCGNNTRGRHFTPAVVCLIKTKCTTGKRSLSLDVPELSVHKKSTIRLRVCFVAVLSQRKSGLGYASWGLHSRNRDSESISGFIVCC